MGKYQFSYEEKITIIREHEENHKTLKAICEEYDISKSYLCYILRDYRENGKESLKNTKYYSAEYKLKVIKRHFEDGISVADLTRETGIQYRINYGLENGDHFIGLLFIKRVKAEGLVFFPKVLFLELLKVRKHRAVFHMMTVDNQVVRWL